MLLQQCLPFTVLKLCASRIVQKANLRVATVLTVYGIETFLYWVIIIMHLVVATVLTVYGIETQEVMEEAAPLLLQQCLPFTVLKRLNKMTNISAFV